MSDYDNTNTGALFKNDKQGNEKRPDYTGVADVDGKEKRMAAWIKTSKSGQKYMSVSFSEPMEQQSSSPQPQPANFDDDVPF